MIKILEWSNNCGKITVQILIVRVFFLIVSLLYIIIWKVTAEPVAPRMLSLLTVLPAFPQWDARCHCRQYLHELLVRSMRQRASVLPTLILKSVSCIMCTEQTRYSSSRSWILQNFSLRESSCLDVSVWSLGSLITCIFHRLRSGLLNFCTFAGS